MSTEKEILLINRLLSEGSNELNGEYWIDSVGNPKLMTEDTPRNDDYDDYEVFGELEWIHVEDAHFKTWTLNKRSLSTIVSFLNEKLDDDSGSIVIEQASNGEVWSVPTKVVLCEGITPEDIARYASGDLHQQMMNTFLSEEP